MAPPLSSKNLRRIFSLVPLIFHRQGIELRTLQKLAGFKSSGELLRSLDRLMMFGAPPFSPSDFISIHVDDRERVWLDFPMGLERPLSLSSGEWTAIQKLIRKELSFIAQKESDEDLVSESLRELLARIGEVPTLFESDEQFLSQRNIIREAMAEKSQIEFLYRSLSSKEPELRRVDPWLLFKNRGNNYLIAYCHTRTSARCFRLERMQNLELLELEQERPSSKDIDSYLESSPLFQKEAKGFKIKLAFAPDILPNLKGYFHLENIEPYLFERKEARKRGKRQGGQWLSADSKIQDSIWLGSTLRSFGTQLILLAPSHLRKSYLEELENTPIPELF